MPDLVMLDLPAGQGFVDELRRVWDAGDAVFPLDARLPPSEARRVIDTAKPTAVVEAGGGRRSLDGGRSVQPGDAIVVATSGTTGQPKAVIHTHDSVRASATATSAALAVDPATDRWLGCLPPAHIGGLAVIMRAILTDTGLVVLDGFEPGLVDEAATDGATLVSVVTRVLNQIDVNAFRRILIGGAAPPPHLADHVIATYGMTETGSGCVYDGYPIDGVSLRTSDGGEVEIRAPLLLRAYRAADGEVEPFTPDGWFPTGDLGRLDPDGRVWIEGRAGEMIISGGENIHPHRVESVLESHPAIVEAAVIGRPDADWGHRVVACIVVQGQAPSIGEVREWVQRELPVWNAPRQLEVVDALPKTALGKIRRGHL